ncbi:PREDICTED: GTPase Era, mitochondrial [Nicrophorus vespilloides]|uniref:GTPase Era, mitochondrial n=1 Tax=Nicrophorus vespilloides TaxID=110193 RepID=A0ABM1M792_NICVS|nr:PREDICTED: GTPase Era, mitochondrial [Nicrophorus vespilloides]
MFFKRISYLFKQKQSVFKDIKLCSSSVVINNIEELEQKLLKVAIVGVPNVGKSTVINHLMDRKVCPTSSKVHTTRKRATAIFTEGDTQVVFLDTPGLVNIKEYNKYKLERSFVKDPNASLQNADIVGVIHDVSNQYTKDRLDLKVIKLLEKHVKKPSFLVLNKIDMLKSKRKLLDITRLLTENKIRGEEIPDKGDFEMNEDSRGWPNFQDIFMVSALTGDGLEDVRNYLLEQAKPGKWLYDAEVWSDQPPETIILNTVKAKFMDFLNEELPYVLVPEMELFEVDVNGVIKTIVNVRCPSVRKAQLIAGANDGRLKNITAAVQKDLQQTFQNFVRISIYLHALPNK